MAGKNREIKEAKVLEIKEKLGKAKGLHLRNTKALPLKKTLS